eukprot:COSAG05_NODE_26318_length_189_cov_29.422222_1_plen_38_part_10
MKIFISSPPPFVRACASTHAIVRSRISGNTWERDDRFA